MTEKDRADSAASDTKEEPFLLTLLPFAGLGLLLILAVVWRVMPSKETEPGGGATPSADEMAEVAISKWEGARARDIPVDPDRDFILGPEEARITVVEFSDFECPYCRNAANGAHAVVEKFDDDVRLVFKNFPLDNACNESLEEPMHRLACEAAVVARCAGEQDPSHFWQVHDALFREPQLSRETLYAIPPQLGLDLEKLDACIGGLEAAQAIEADIALGRALGIRGTPVLYVNGKRMSDYRRPALEAVVEHILSEDE